MPADLNLCHTHAGRKNSVPLQTLNLPIPVQPHTLDDWLQRDVRLPGDINRLDAGTAKLHHLNSDALRSRAHSLSLAWELTSAELTAEARREFGCPSFSDAAASRVAFHVARTRR